MTDLEMHDETEAGSLHLDGTVILDVADRQVRRSEQARAATARDHRDPVGDVAVLLPCRDEEATIAKVVSDFRSALPAATIYVYDNARPTTPLPLPLPPERSCDFRRIREREAFCAGCSPRSMPPCTCWPTGTIPTTHPLPPAWSIGSIADAWTWSWVGGSISATMLVSTAWAIDSVTGSSPGQSTDYSAADARTCCRATASSLGGT